MAIALLIATYVVIAIASPKGADRSDERDQQIDRYGEYVGGLVVFGGALVALGLALAELEYFWIANLIYSILVLVVLTASAVKILAYRRGFQPW